MTIKKLAVQVDERLAELFTARAEHQIKSGYAADAIRRAAGQKSDYKTGTWDGDFQSALTILKNDPSEYRKRPIAEWENHNRQNLQISFEVAELSAVWAEEKWTRAFLVVNGNGHIHSSTLCSTCFTTTNFEWLTEYSADPEDTIVALAGETACTVCYPSAPAEILNRPATIQSKTRAEREAAAAERAAAKAVKEAKRFASAATATGEVLVVPSSWRVGSSEELKTERSAVIFWNTSQQTIEWEKSEGSTAPGSVQAQEIIEQALAGKRGVTATQVREELLTKYQKKRY